MSDDDDDKTVFGQALPPFGSNQPPRPGAPAAPTPPAPTAPDTMGPDSMRPDPMGDDKTVFGTPLPTSPAPGGAHGAPRPPEQPYAPSPPPHQPRVAPTSRTAPIQPPPVPRPPLQSPPHQKDEWGGSTWMEEPFAPPSQPSGPPFTSVPPQPAPYAPAPPTSQPYPPHPATPNPALPRDDFRAGAYIAQTGQRSPREEIFPEFEDPRQAEQTPQVGRQKIPLQHALQASGLDAGGSTNPLIAAASNLMILLGRLRTGMVEMQSAPLLEHVTREIDLFERNALAAGVAPVDAQDAKYALCATADDIVQNLPGVDRGMWSEYRMAARFFNDLNAGVGFYERMDVAMRAPGQRFDLLELMLTCLSLGFQGQYRNHNDGGTQLSRIRGAIYETLRRIKPRPDDDISVRWMPVVFRGKRRRGGPPIWAVGAVGATMVVALFLTLSYLLSNQNASTVQRIGAIHAQLPQLTMEAAQPVRRSARSASSQGQIDRLTAAMQTEIAAGQVTLDTNKKEWIALRLNEALRFRSGRADLVEDVSPLLQSIAAAIDAEQGPIRIVGHSDGDGCCRSGPFRSNEALSEGRAITVLEKLSPMVADSSRLQAEGKGFSQPLVAPETSRADKAQNRRVEIMIQREF